MNHITTTDLLEHLNWRYATKQFDPAKSIAPEIWTALEDTLVLTPSSYGVQPWKFLIVTSPELKAQLQPYSWNQSQVTDCSHYVVFAIRKNLTAEDIDRFIARTAQVRESSIDAIAGYRNAIVSDLVDGTRSFNINDWSTRQTYIALGNFMTSAALLGVDTCAMEGIEPVNYDRLLGLSARGFTTVVACAAGYRSEADKYASLAKVRFPKSEILETL
jgi:nitroreductase